LARVDSDYAGCGGAVASRSSGTRIAIQGRLDAFNMFGVTDSFVADDAAGGLLAFSAFAPTATAGIRLLDTRLFLGLGFGLTGVSVSECEDGGCDGESSASKSGFTLTPMVTFDVLSGDDGALHVGGWFNLGSIGDTTFEEADGDTMTRDDGFFMWGVNLAAGVRGKISEGLAIGSEFGWGFLTWSEGDEAGDQSPFIHGVFGTILVEGSVGI